MNISIHYDELLDLLSPLLQNPAERRALLLRTCGADSSLLRHIDFSGPVEPFIINLLAQLQGYGEVAPGRPAWVALLETARKQVGCDRQARIDALLAGRKRPDSQPKLPLPNVGVRKIEFCDRLGDDWRRLADYLEIPPSNQATFHKGDEGRDIWVWLENRRRLSKLPAASIAIHRQDLAQLLNGD